MKKPDPSVLIEDIRRSGAKRVLDRLYSDAALWDALLDGIASGAEDWFKIVKAVKPVSDAGSAFELNLAASEALEVAPERVLGLANGELYDFGFEEACGTYGFAGVGDKKFGYEEIVAKIARREKAVRSITDRKLQRAREICLEKIGKLRVDVDKSFGK